MLKTHKNIYISISTTYLTVMIYLKNLHLNLSLILWIFFSFFENIMHYGLQAQNILGRFSIVKLLESVQNLSVAYIFHYVWSSLEIMCTAFIVLLLENTELFYILLLFCFKLKYLLSQACLNA